MRADGRFGPEVEQRAQNKRHTSAWVVLAAALLVALGAALVIAELGGDADADRRASLLLKDLKTQAYRLSSLEWQAVAEGRLDPELDEEARDARGRMARSLDEMAQLDLRGEEEGACDGSRQLFAPTTKPSTKSFGCSRPGGWRKPKPSTKSGWTRTSKGSTKRSGKPTSSTAPTPSERSGAPTRAPFWRWAGLAVL